MSILSNALSGLFASRSALVTTTNNISNSNTEGYSRQRAVFVDQGSQYLSGIKVGQGVSSGPIERSATDLLNEEIARNTSLNSSLSTNQKQLSRIDSIISADGTGINDAFNDFFGAAQDLSVRPTDIVSRNSFLSKAKSLTDRFNDLSRVMTGIKDESNKQISESVAAVNDLTGQISKLNTLIMQSKQGGQPPNDLLDQRDTAVQKLSELVDVDRVIQENGSFSLFLKNGQPLVADSANYDVSVQQNPSNPKDVQIGIQADFLGDKKFVAFGADKLGNGKIGGLLQANKQIDGYLNTLGLVALRFGEEVNKATTSGFDLDGNPGKPLVTFAGAQGINNGFSQVIPNANNSNPSTTLAQISFDSSTLVPKDLEVYKKGGDVYVRTKDTFTEGTKVTPDSNGIYSTGEVSFSITGPFADNDSILLSPVKDAAKNIQIALTDPYDVATSGSSVTRGDNTVLQNIVALQEKTTVYTSSGAKGSTLLSAFNDLVNQVGNDKKQVDTSLTAQEALLNKVTADKDSASGVNLDEEAANLVKFQHSYQAASQVMAVEKSLFQDFLKLF